MSPQARWFLAGMLGVSAWCHLWLIVRVMSRRPVLAASSRPPGRVTWGPGLLALVLAAVFVTATLVTSVFGVLRGSPLAEPARPAVADGRPARPGTPVSVTNARSPHPPRSSTETVVIGSVVNLILLVLVPLSAGVLGARPSDFGLGRGGVLRDLRVGAFAFFVVTPWVQFVFYLALRVVPTTPQKHDLEIMLRDEAPGWPLVVLAGLAATVLAPVLEELVFRGLIQGWLRSVCGGDVAPGSDGSDEGVEVGAGRPRRLVWLPRSLGGWVPAGASGLAARGAPVLLTSFFFAAVHYRQMPAPVAIFVLSIALGALYERTRGLLPSVVLHALFNGFNTALLLIELSAAPAPRLKAPSGAQTHTSWEKTGESHAFSLARGGRPDNLLADQPLPYLCRAVDETSKPWSDRRTPEFGLPVQVGAPCGR